MIINAPVHAYFNFVVKLIFKLKRNMLNPILTPIMTVIIALVIAFVIIMKTSITFVDASLKKYDSANN